MIPAAKSGSASSRFFCFPAGPGEGTGKEERGKNMRQLLKNARVYDGTGSEPYQADILLEEDRIAMIAPKIDLPADNVIDLTGKSVSSGFIDAHSHNDWFAIKKEPLPYFRPFLLQGITTFIAGNCGISEIGFEKGNAYLEKMGGGIFGFKDTVGQFGTAEEYFQATDRNMPCNMAVLAGHCTARAAAGGIENRKLTPDEEKRMLEILEQALLQGAAGISLGLMYQPGLYADVEELKKVAALCVKYNKPLTVHPRAESKVSMAYPQLFGRSHLLRAVDELAEISKGTNLKLQYSHAIFVGRKTLKDKDELLQIFDSLRAEGVDVMFDIYNECLGVSVITVILPAWYQAMNEKQRNSLMTRIKLSVLVKATSRLLGFGFKDIQIAYIGPGYEKYEGKTVHQIAQEEGTSDLKAYKMLCEKSNFAGRVNMGPYSTPEIISAFEHDDRCLYMTDAWVEDHGVQNPAVYDCYPKFLRDALRGTGDTMAKTIRKMTGAVADRFMLLQRGYLKEGYYADLTVFDEEALRNGIPDREQSFGIEKVFINGRLVYSENMLDEHALKKIGRAIPVG